MKLLHFTFVILIIASLFLVACEPEDIPPILDQEEAPAAGMTNEEITEYKNS